jgi:hypothetical protein
MTREEMTNPKSIEAEPPGCRKLARALMARLEDRMCQREAASHQDVENINRFYRVISNWDRWVLDCRRRRYNQYRNRYTQSVK